MTCRRLAAVGVGSRCAAWSATASAEPHAGQVATQPVAESQLSAVQVLPSLQVIAVFEQTPPEQLSVVQALASSQLIGVFEHAAACVGRAAIAVVAVGVGRACRRRGKRQELITSIRPQPKLLSKPAHRVDRPVMMN